MTRTWAEVADVVASVMGIYICFLCQGVCQESIYKLKLVNHGPWGTTPDTKFKYPLFLVSLMCSMSAVFGYVITKLESQPSKVIPAFCELFDSRTFERLNTEPAADDALQQVATGGTGGTTESQVLGTKNAIKRTRTQSGVETLAASQAPLDTPEMEREVRRKMLIQGFYVSISYLGAMIATNFALTRVYYPMQVIVKSAKAIPVIVGGYVFFGKTYHYSDYLTVFCVTVSLVLFQTSSLMNTKSDAGSTWLGFLALLLALFFDGLTGPRQDKMVEMYQISVGDLMVVINVCAMPMSWFYSAIFEGSAPYTVLMNNASRLIPRICLFLVCGSLGQIFIVRILRSLGALHLTLITTTRKFLGILISVALYGHHLSGIQWFSVFLLFSSGFFKYFLKEKPSHAAHAADTARQVELPKRSPHESEQSVDPQRG